MWSHLFQSCMHSYMHCRVLSLLSCWSEQIDDVDFFDWDCDWFWRMTTLTCLTIFNFFFAAFLYSRVVFSKWTFLSIVLFCIIQLSQNVEVYFRSTIKNFSTNIVSKLKKFLNIESQNLTFEIFSIRYSNFNLIFEWRLLQCLKFLVYLFLNLIVDFLVFND
jgi:hypothetical protein